MRTRLNTEHIVLMKKYTATKMNKMQRIAKEMLLLLVIMILLGLAVFGFIMLQEGESGWAIMSTISLILFYLIISSEK